MENPTSPISNSNLSQIVGIIGAIVLFVVVFALALAYSALSWGFVLYKFWYWFLLPVFTTAPAITFIQAVGLMMVIGLFHNQVLPIIKKEYSEVKIQQIMAILAPWIVVAVGALVKHFIVH